MNEALLKNANSLLGLGRQREALLSYERYLLDRPDSAEAWHNRGVALGQLQRHEEALNCFGKALALRPDAAQSWYARGHAELECKHYEQAQAAYERALALNPTLSYAPGYALLAKLWCCDWRGLTPERARIAEGIAAGRRMIPPFGNLMVSGDLDQQQRCARIWMEGRHGVAAPLWRGERYSHQRIRIAYISGDFRVHPVSILMAGVFEQHDKARFDIICISFGPDDRSELRSRIARGMERFIDVRGRSDLEIASLLRELEVDIAVDLMGLTADCRSGIFSHRPAPAQVNYLGYPGTMAVPFMDYVLADAVVLNENDAGNFSEKIVTLPVSYMASDNARSIGPAPTRAAASLPETGFVFAGFNNPYKFSPEMFDVWMRLLIALPGSVLWLSEMNAAAMRNLRREAEQRGVPSARLIFAPFLTRAEDHLARMGLADLFLDTLPCNAHTNASDALWAGVPVVTAMGTSFAGRVAASLLSAAGLPELIAHSLREYETLAVRLAREPQTLAGLKSRLMDNRTTQPLFDTAGFTRTLEAAYTAICERSRCGEAPQSFSVARAA